MTNENVTLPLLPLKSGVILPGMVFTMALESTEARVAVEAARSAGGHLLLVPHIEGRYANVGVIAEVMEEGSLPGGLEAIVIRGDQRATIGTGVPGTGDALWVEAEPLDDGESTAAVVELAREYRAVLENILLSRGARQIAAQLREITEPDGSPTSPATPPTCRSPRRSRSWRRSTSRPDCVSCSDGPATPWPT
jgi:ATP-dependent Lon protease